MSPGISRCGPRLRSGRCTYNRRVDSSHRAIAPVCRPLPDEFRKSTRNRSPWTATGFHCISCRDASSRGPSRPLLHGREGASERGFNNRCPGGVTLTIHAKHLRSVRSCQVLTGVSSCITIHHGRKSNSTESNSGGACGDPVLISRGGVRLWCGCLGLFLARAFERFLSCKQSFPFERLVRFLVWSRARRRAVKHSRGTTDLRVTCRATLRLMQQRAFCHGTGIVGMDRGARSRLEFE